MNKFKRGFTLIELLVVIAIIGILSSVVLASLNTARGKGADAAIKSNLANIRAQAEIQYDTWGTYGNADATPQAVAEGACPASGADNVFGTPNVAAQIAAAVTASGGTARCSADAGTAWAVSVPLKTNTANAWCVDSTGASKSVTAGDAGIAANACV